MQPLAFARSHAPHSAPSLPGPPGRHAYYLALLECLEAVCNPLTADVLSWRGGEGEPSVADVLGRVQLQASHFVRVCGGGANAGGAAPSGGGRRGGASQAVASGESLPARPLLPLLPLGCRHMMSLSLPYAHKAAACNLPLPPASN